MLVWVRILEFSAGLVRFDGFGYFFSGENKMSNPYEYSMYCQS